MIDDEDDTNAFRDHPLEEWNEGWDWQSTLILVLFILALLMSAYVVRITGEVAP
jgi:hypothetical protein